MQFQLCHENDTSLRLRLDRHHLSGKEEQILSDILSLHPQITGIQIYPATAGLRIFFKGSKAKLLESLEAISYGNILFLAEGLPKTEDFHVQLLPSGKEIIRELSTTKKMNPGLKKKIGKEISLEAIADLILPTPLSLAFHVYQLLLLAKA